MLKLNQYLAALFNNIFISENISCRESSFGFVASAMPDLDFALFYIKHGKNTPLGSIFRAFDGRSA